MDLGREAFSVFCDNTVDGAVAKNRQHREEQASLEALDTIQHSVHIVSSFRENDQGPWYKCAEGTLVVDLRAFVAKTKRWLLYRVNTAQMCKVPLERLSTLNLIISGVELPVPEGKIHNYPGTVDDIRTFVQDGSRVQRFFLDISVTSPGRPPRPRDDCLFGATLEIEKFVLARYLVRDHLKKPKPPLNAHADYEELHLLSQVAPNHNVVTKVYHEHRTLMESLCVLRSSKRLFQSFAVHANNSAPILLDLRQASAGQTRQHGSYWRLQVPENQSLVSINDIPNLYFKLSGVRLVPSVFHGPEASFTNASMSLKYKKGFGVRLYFMSFETFCGDHHDLQLQNVYYPVSSVISKGPQPQVEGIKIKLMYVTIDASLVRRHMRLLGMEHPGMNPTIASAASEPTSGEGDT
ncbi:expressed unknown protein [Seminavis robusta]|uniref:Uncharacterized protein n=1 Tax=Seminavis robusta TaxID=568900 RepID=A0A9N8EI56_9STRA|nr:expressed unknown protein [Seminavis robusta]|eukprot:Sro992_g228780.1 n/a (408) ;mRNA; f:4813-6132